MADPPASPTVYIVDDDNNLRGVIETLVRSVGLAASPYPSARQFLEGYRQDAPGCVLSDIRMPGMSGIELVEALRARSFSIPVILMTSFADVALAVGALRAGAWDLVEKPFGQQDLLDRVQRAIARDSATWSRTRQREDVARRSERLSVREREVFDRVVQGMLNKQIADDLEVSIKTVELHRAHLMEKMEATSLADLVRMAVLLEAPK
jgi:FixJ family two-component response regulator